MDKGARTMRAGPQNRNGMPNLASYALACVLLGTAASGQAQVYKCLDDQGRVSYGEMPCKGQKQLPYAAGSVTTIEGIKPTPTPIPTPAPPEPVAQARQDVPADNLPQPTPDPNLPAGVNCNVDNPGYDSAFCSPRNLRGLYGPPVVNPLRGRRLSP